MPFNYKKHPSFLLGFHGCDKKIGEAVLAGEQGLASSENEYDWLGAGIYFWESNPDRAMQFAREAMTRPQTTKGAITDPFVVGAIIDLGVCCNLHDQSSLDELSVTYELLKTSMAEVNMPLPENKIGSDKVKRNLDCAVINYMHTLRKKEGLLAYDSVRAAFHEGGELYGGSGFTRQGHMQIAVRSERQILGYFRPRVN